MKRIIATVSLLCLALSAHAAPLDELRNDAPERYVVVKGDTLWGIAERFLKAPWKWPDLWSMNRAEIRNPHRIYPGDVIVLVKDGGDAELKLLHQKTVRLTPQVRSEPLDENAIPSIPLSVIEPFLTRPLVVEDDSLQTAPRIVSADEERVLLGTGSRAYIAGLPEGEGDRWFVYRPGNVLKDPESGEALGIEAIYLGNARITAEGNPATALITHATQEMNIGDRLVPAPPPEFITYAPHAPDQELNGSIIHALGNVAEFGQNAIIVINKGEVDGVDRGTVLAIYRRGEFIKDTEGEDGKPLRLPDERYGLAFVFRTFERVSYALVMQITRPAHVGDYVRAP